MSKGKKKDRRIIKIIIGVVAVILIISFIAYIILSTPSEEEPPEPKWWSYESYCTGVSVTNVTKTRDATGWNITAYLFLDEEYRNHTVRYIIDWGDGNQTDDSLKSSINSTEYVFIGEQKVDMHYPREDEPLSILVIVSDCD